jgi:hypothetical protein
MQLCWVKTQEEALYITSSSYMRLAQPVGQIPLTGSIRLVD